MSMGFVIRATWTAEAGSEQLVREVLAELAPLSRAEPGNQQYVVHQAADQPRVFHLFEVYDDEESYRVHGSSEHFRRLAVERGIPALESREREFSTVLEL
jgi:quinol monooxygenase YgiN